LRGKRSYQTSLSVLSTIRKLAPEILVKSSILLGLGEEREEVKETILELRRAGCDVLVLGQYLKPSPSSWEVQRIIRDEEFECYREFALGLGFRYVFAGTWMRSSNAIFC
jgi:lipoic acid synthetase